MKHALQVEILKELLAQVNEGRNIDAGVQYRMPTTSYVCPDVAARERKEFFQNHPQLIGLAKDLPKPGSYLTMDDFGTPILATRDKDGGFHAFLNACRHRSAKVASEERGTKSVFMCPFHHWSYSNKGNLLNIPDEEQFGTVDKSCNGLIELPAVERDGLLWIHPQPDGELDVEALLGTALTEELASINLSNHIYMGTKTIDMKLNWKFANDTFGETYHFGKLHKDTLGQLFIGNNLHLQEFGRHHRFVTANYGIQEMCTYPEEDWNINAATFVLYHLFPNIQLVAGPQNATLVRIYPDASNPGRSVTKVSFYYTQDMIDKAASEEAPQFDVKSDLYDRDKPRVDSLEGSMEIFTSTVEQEDYLMGEMQQAAAENGTLKEIMFGRNEPALHHFHNNYREALGLPSLEKV
jgi:phenylpropionate dioxygenase-like ring-hydroxylating dioxygenase large terminal subunit